MSKAAGQLKVALATALALGAVWGLLGCESAEEAPLDLPQRPSDAATMRDAGARDSGVRAPTLRDAGVQIDLDARAASDLDAHVASSDAGEAKGVSCSPALFCPSIRTSAFSLDACCTEQAECGLDLVGMPELRDAFFSAFEKVDASTRTERCVPSAKLFSTNVTVESEKVSFGDGGVVLNTSECKTALIFGSFAFPGCCLPNNSCGVSTYPFFRELSVLFADTDAPFTHIQCTSVEELNAQFRDVGQDGLAQLPPTGGSCDYATLRDTLVELDHLPL